MQLKRVKLKNWKNIRKAEIDFSSGINIISGRNEIGKSTIIEALEYAFLQPANTKSRDSIGISPWGTSLKGEINVYFVTEQGKTYSLYKSFPGGNSSLAVIGDSGREIELHNTNTKVQEELFKLLGISEDKSGLFNLLWIGQGKSLNLFSDKDNPFTNNKAFNLKVRKIIKENIISKESEEFYNYLLKENDLVFTSTNKLKKNSAMYRMQEKEEKLNELINGIKTKLNKAAEINTAIEELSGKVENMEARLGDEEKKLQDLLIRQKNYKKEEEKYKLETANYETKKAEFNSIEKDYTEIIKIDEKLADLEIKIKKDTAALNLFRTEQKGLAEKHEKLEFELKQYTRYNEYLTIILKIRNLREKLEPLKRREKELNDVKALYSSLTDKIEKLSVKDGTLVKEAENITAATEKLKIEIKSSSLQINLTAKQKIQVDIEQDKNDKKRLTLNENQKSEIFSSGNIKIDIPDIIDIDISSNADSRKLKQLNKNLKENKNKLEQIFRDAGLNSIEKIKEEYEKYKGFKEELERLKIKRDTLLDSYKNKDQLKTEIENINREIEQNRKDAGREFTDNRFADKGFRDKGELQDGIETETQKTVSEIIRLKNKLKLLERDKEEKQKSILEAEKDATADKTEKETLEKRKRNILRSLNAEHFKENYLKRKDEIEHAKKMLDKMKPLPADEIKDEVVESLKKTINKIKEERDKNKSEIDKLKGSLNILIGEDLLAEKSEYEFEHNEVLNKLINERKRIYSIKLLINLIEKEKKNLDKNVLFPVEERLKKAFNSITNNRYLNIPISNDFKISEIKAFAPDKSEITAAADILSYGTKEQLSFLFRFVIAQFLSSKELQVMVLDDSFVNTDFYRLKKIISMIDEFSDRIQFLIFTWNRENYLRYKDIFNANFIDLEPKILTFSAS